MGLQCGWGISGSCCCYCPSPRPGYKGLMNREASPSVATGQFLFFRQVGQLFSASIVGQGMGLVRSMVLTVFFSPAQLGVWNFLHVIFGYGANAHLGILSGMNKLVPRYLAQGEDER